MSASEAEVRIEVRITPALLLFMLAEGPCENFTGATTCQSAGRHPLAKYGADQMCVPCMAKIAQRTDQE